MNQPHDLPLNELPPDGEPVNVSRRRFLLASAGTAAGSLVVGFTLPAGKVGALFALTTSAATRIAPTGSPTASGSLAAPTQLSATSLVVLPKRDRRVSLVARKGTVVTVTIVGWV